jgi:H+/Cl- antiporter ClcA
MTDITGLMQVAPNGTEVGVGLIPSADGDGNDYVVQFVSKVEGMEPIVTTVGLTKETLATMLVVMMKLPGGLRVPGVGTVSTKNGSGQSDEVPA